MYSFFNFFLAFLLFFVFMAILPENTAVRAESFLPPKTAYDETLARRLLSLAAGAYALTPNDCIEKTLPSAEQWQFLFGSSSQICDGFKNSCGFYIVASNATREVVVVFRGTKGKKQLLIEGWQAIKPGRDLAINGQQLGKVNKYFMKAVTFLWDDVLRVLNNTAYSGFRITFTGHSLGGALASLAALKAVADGLCPSQRVRLYTFGMPRIGNPEFARRHEQLVSESFRVVNRADMVPHLPPCAKDPAFEGVTRPCDPNNPDSPYHHGVEIWYPRGMYDGAKYKECLGLPTGEDILCSDSLSFEMNKYSTYVYDHRHYFRHRVPRFGKAGCPVTAPPPTSSDPDSSAPGQWSSREEEESTETDSDDEGVIPPPSPAAGTLSTQPQQQQKSSSSSSTSTGGGGGGGSRVKGFLEKVSSGARSLANFFGIS